MTENQKNLGLDEIVSIEDVGIIDTYDFTIPGTHCFFANDILVHNSLEEDADIIFLGHRDYEYTKKEEDIHKAEWEIAKHRQGATCNIKMYWNGKTVTFSSLQEGDYYEH